MRLHSQVPTRAFLARPLAALTVSAAADVHAPLTGEPSPSSSSSSTTTAATATPDRSVLGLALVAALMLVLAAVSLVLARRRRAKALEAAPQRRSPAASRCDAFPVEDLTRVDWFRVTDVSAVAVAPNGDQPRATDSFCGSWEHPDVEASRIPAGELRLVHRIHRGAHSDVFRARFRGAAVAVRKPAPQWLANVRHLDALFCEVRLLAALRHAHIVAFVGVAWRSLLDVHVVTEFMDGGDLRALLRRFDADEDAARRRPRGFDRDKVLIAAQVAAALAHLHAQAPRRLTHMALRSRNVLLSTDWTAKLTDFRAASVEQYVYDQPAGSAHGVWSAPEVLRGDQADDKADVFSFGVLLAEMDSHRAPYAGVGAAESDGEGEDEADGGRASADHVALLSRIASGRVSVQFSPASSVVACTPKPIASVTLAVPTVGELVNLRQARGAAGSSHSSSQSRSGAAAALSLVSAASFVASPFVHAEVARIGRACVAFDPAGRPSARELERELRALAQTFDAFEGR